MFEGYIGMLGMQLLEQHGNKLIWFAVSVVVLLLLLLLFKRRQPQSYFAIGPLFTETEWKFHTVLQEAIGGDALLMGKVRIADILCVNRDFDNRARMSAFSKISSKHIDFVVVSPTTGYVLACIELDDASHQRKDRIERDIFVNAAFDEADLPLLRIPTRKTYDAQALRHALAEAINAAPAK